jgi:hypothetical protein
MLNYATLHARIPRAEGFDVSAREMVGFTIAAPPRGMFVIILRDI